MKYIKAITFLVVALVLLFLLAALFMPSEFKLERSIEINSPFSMKSGNGIKPVRKQEPGFSVNDLKSKFS